MTAELPDELIWPALKVTSVSAAQVLVFVFFYEAAVQVYVSNYAPMNKLFGFGMQVDVGLYLLSILAGLHSLAHFHLTATEHKLISTILCTAVWIAYWGNIADVVPNRFALLSILGMLSFFIGALLSSPQVHSRNV